MGNYGIKTTVAGKDITSTTKEDYIVWSKYSFMKTYLVGTENYTFSSDANSVTITITHNLGDRKAVWVSINGPNAEWKQWDWWAFWYQSGGNTALRFWTVETNSNQVLIKYGESNVQGSGYNPNGETWSFNYYIFIESLA